MSGREFLTVSKATFNEFNRADVPYMAAALTYYAFFSLFPLLLLGLIIIGAFVSPGTARDFIFGQVATVTPGVVDMLRETLAEVLENRDSAGWIAILGIGTLLFSASGAFDALDKAINRAWHTEAMPNLLIAKLSSFVMMIVIAALLGLSVIVSTLLRGTRRLTTYLLGDLPGDTLVWHIINIAASLGITILAFLLLFRFVPRCHVRMRDVYSAAILTAVVWTVAKEVFAFIVGSSFANFSAVYGTLGTVIALLTWIYVSSVIILTGAEFSAETARVRRLRAKAFGAERDAQRKPSPWLAR